MIEEMKLCRTAGLWMSLLIVVMMAGCGGGSSSSSAVSGVVASGAAMTGLVYLKDSC